MKAFEEVLLAWIGKPSVCLGRHIGAGVYAYKGICYHIGTGKPVLMY